MDAPETPHQHHEAHTGHRWLDIVLAVSAMFVSVISLIVAIEHGRTMERMAEANTKMVEANSWPFVEFDTHNVDEQGKPEFRFVLTNAGIGPARIQTFEMWFDGKPMASIYDIFDACCRSADAQSRQREGTTYISLGTAAPNILRAGDHENFFTMTWDKDAENIAAKFNEGRVKITTRTCYCSVFDECWVSSGLTTQATKVPSCSTPAVPFRTDVRRPNALDLPATQSGRQ
jgi:hypothetical protein